jgi:hypothetical protein
MKKPFVLIVLLAAVMLPRPAAAWSFEAHKYITGRVIALLPPAIRPFFEKYRVTVVEHSIDPDLWRSAGWEAEPPRHYVDLDSYGTYPFADLPRDYDAAVQKYGKDFVDKNGLLPWRTDEIYKKLVEAFTQKTPYSRDNIKFFGSVLAHYLADAHVPFHSTTNHDGQLTGQWGLHSRFESDLFERYRSRLRVVPKPLVQVGNVRDFTFDTLVASFQYVQPVLDADKTAIGHKDVYDDGYYTMFFGKVQPILEKRLSDAITDIASAITAAWVEAGRPALPLAQQRAPKKVRRQ